MNALQMMKSEKNIKEENIANAIQNIDQMSSTPGNSVTNGLEGSDITLISEEDQSTSIAPLNSQANVVDSSDNISSKGSKGNIDFGLNILQFDINSPDIYVNEPGDRKQLSKGINNPNFNKIKKSKEIAKMNVSNEESKVKHKNVAHINQNPYNPIASISVSTSKRKRGRPRKGTCTQKEIYEQHLASKHRNSSNTQSFSKKSTYFKVDVNESENEIVGKPKRRRRSRKMKDYITEFNSSDEEDTNSSNILVGSQSQSRKNVSARNISKQNHAKDTDIYNMDIDDCFIESDFFNETSLEFSESDSEMTQSSQIEDCKHILEIGPEKKTKLEIINTGELETLGDNVNVIYHLVATTGNTSTISQLLIPNTVKNNEATKNTSGKQQAAFTKKKPNQTSNILSSSEKKLKGKLQRSYKRKLAELKQKVNFHLREMRRRPQSSTIPELLNAASKFLTQEQLVFLSMQLKTKHVQSQNMRFSVREKLLSLALYQQSPSVYKYLTTVFHLPSKLILERWLESIAKADPLQAKRLMYHVYSKYIYRM